MIISNVIHKTKRIYISHLVIFKTSLGHTHHAFVKRIYAMSPPVVFAEIERNDSSFHLV